MRRARRRRPALSTEPTPTGPTTTGTAQAEEPAWAAHLSALELAVADARAALRDTTRTAEVVLDEDVLRASEPPGRLGPGDADRARALLGDLQDLLAELELVRGRTARELRLHRRLAAGRPPTGGALYLDDRS